MNSRQQRIIDLYEKGFTKESIKRLVRCRQEYISETIRQAGIKARGLRTNATRVQQEQARTMYRQGIKIAEIVRSVGISEHNARKALHEAGIDTSVVSSIGRDPVRQKRIVEMYGLKCTAAEISRTLSISITTVYRELKLAGVSGRNWCGPRTSFVRYVASDGRLTKFRSSWEAAFARYLDKHGLEWAYESHSWILSDGSAYTPDFWVPSLQIFFEIKGYLTEEAKWKINDFRVEYPKIDLQIIDQETFKLRGIELPKFGTITDGFYHPKDDAETTGPMTH